MNSAKPTPIPSMTGVTENVSAVGDEWLQPLIDADAVNAAKARAVIEFMDCPPEREAELADLIRKPQGVVISKPGQARLAL